MKRKILVCGATGFIGTNIAEYLAGRPDLEVCGTYFKSQPLANPGIKMIKADLTDKKQVDELMKEGPDIIIQAAATTSGAKDIVTKPYYHVTDNAVMNSLIFRAAYECKVAHVVFFSCTVMYKTSKEPLKETDFDANEELFSSYFGVGWTKVYLEKVCEFYSRIGQAKYTVIRHSNIYGPHDKFDLEKSHVFGASMTKVMRAQDGSTINIWGSGEEERDLLYIEDLVRFVEIALDKQASPFELVNAGSGSPISVNDLIKKIIFHSGKNLDMRHDLSKPNIKTKVCLDISKAKKIFGWAPAVSLDEGIKRTMQWYGQNIGIEDFKTRRQM